MSDEMKKHRHAREDRSPHKARHKRVRGEGMEREMLGKRNELFPALSLAMNMMKRSQSSPDEEETVRSLKETEQSDPDRKIMRDRLQEKLGELLEEEQALIELYVKAARAAKEKEEEYKERISELVDQSERDKQLMEIFRSI